MSLTPRPSPLAPGRPTRCSEHGHSISSCLGGCYQQEPLTLSDLQWHECTALGLGFGILSTNLDQMTHFTPLSRVWQLTIVFVTILTYQFGPSLDSLVTRALGRAWELQLQRTITRAERHDARRLARQSARRSRASGCSGDTTMTTGSSDLSSSPSPIALPVGSPLPKGSSCPMGLPRPKGANLPQGSSQSQRCPRESGGGCGSGRRRTSSQGSGPISRAAAREAAAAILAGKTPALAAKRPSCLDTVFFEVGPSVCMEARLNRSILGNHEPQRTGNTSD